jgi:hypothetical protein
MITFDSDVVLADWSLEMGGEVGAPDYTVKGQVYKVGDDGIPYGSPILETANLTPVASDYLVADYSGEILGAGRYCFVMYFTDILLDGGNYATHGVRTLANRTYYGGVRASYTPAGGWSIIEVAEQTATSILNYGDAYKKTIEFLGNIDFSNAREDQDYFYCSVLRSDLLIDVLNNRDKEVRLSDTTDIQGNPVITNTLKDLIMHSFKIYKRWEGTKRSESSAETLSDLDSAYVLFAYDVINADEIDESQDLTYVFKTTMNGNNTDAIWVADEHEGDTDITTRWDVQLYHHIENTDAGNQTFEHQIYLKAEIYNSADALLDTLTYQHFRC